MADGGRRGGGRDAARMREEIAALEKTRERVYSGVEGAISSALRDGFARGASPIRAFSNSLKNSMSKAISDALAATLTGGKMNIGLGGGRVAAGGGLFGGGGGFFGTQLGGMLGGLGITAGLSLIGGLFDKGVKAPIARPEPLGPEYGGQAIDRTRPLYGSRRMQLAQFSARNIEGAIHRMAAEGPQISVEVELNDRGNFQKEVVRATVKQMGRERRRGLRRHEY